MSNLMRNQKQSKRSYIPPERRRTVPVAPKKLTLDNENFPALSSNVPKLTQPNCIDSFAKTVQIETTPVVETKPMETPVTTVFQSNVGRRMEENRTQELWSRLLREDVQPRLLDDPTYDRYIHVYQVKYEETFNQEEYSESSEEETEEESDVEE
jgi:hypothetical protein